MEKTKMLVLSVCLTFMLLGCTEEVPVTSCGSCTNATMTSNNTESSGTIQPAAATTPLPGHTSTHVTTNNHNNATKTPPSTSFTSAASSRTTANNTSSQQPTKSTPPAGSAGTTRPTSSAATSSSLFGPRSQLLVPAISVLLCGVLG